MSIHKPYYKLSSNISQEIDCEKLIDKDDGDGYNFIDISTENTGDESYFVIETKRWAFDNLDEFFDIIRDFEKKFKKLGDV